MPRAAVSIAAATALALFGSGAITAATASAATRAAARSGTLGTAGTAGTAAAAVTAPVATPHNKPAAAPRYLAAPRSPALPAGVRQECATPRRPGQMACMALIRTNVKGHKGIIPDVTPAGYGPGDLQSAYNLAAASASAGAGETVAVVDAYDDPNAASDLAVYRAQYGLPACDASTGAGCVTVVNQDGAASPLPPVDPTGTGGWEAEESTDLDMVSATCPNCHILLAEASTDSITDLGAAEDYAAAHASFVSNSWGSGGEYTGETAFDSVYFDHPGVAIAFASGDLGYGVQYPAASQFVTSVGGTTLNRDTSAARGWTESVWDGTGSGCSAAEPEAAWQQSTVAELAPGSGSLCQNRTDNDVAAVADPGTPVAIYDTYPQSGAGAPAPGWSAAGGTSVATPIIASVYALAGSPAKDTYPAQYPYLNGGSDTNDVTSGSDGTCEPARQPLCNGETGYDGPTGFGSPDGTAAFTLPAATGDVVTVKDPGVQDYTPGLPVSLQLAGLSSKGETLSWSASSLPGGLSIDPATGLISGTVTGNPGTWQAQVTATDTDGTHGTVTFAMVVVPDLNASYTAGSGEATLALGGLCLDDTGNSSGNGTRIQVWQCLNDASQRWQFTPDGNPGGAGTLNIHGKCADITDRSTSAGAKVQLWACTGGANQQWFIAGGGLLENPVSGLCLDDPGSSTSNGTQADIAVCADGTNQAWTLPASEVLSGVGGKCLDDTNDSSGNGNKIQIWQCLNDASQKWVYEPDGTVRVNGKCLDVTNESLLDGAPIQLWACTGAANQDWVVGAGGELINANSSRCLDDPGDNAGNGTKLVQQDCYGQAGEVWAVS